MLRPKLLTVASTLLVLFMGASAARAQVSGSWNVDANGDYNTAGNWLGGNIPGAGGVFTMGESYGLSAGRTINLASGLPPTLSGLTYNTAFFNTFDATLSITAQSGVNFNLNVISFAGITPALFGNGALINGAISGTPTAFVKTGSGTITLNASNTFIAPVQINAGELRITTGDAALGNAANTVSLDGGVLRISAAALTSGRTFTIGSGGGTIRTFVASTLNGTLTGTGTLTKEIGSSLTINGDGTGFTGAVNNFSGGIVLGGALGALGGLAAFDNSSVLTLTNATANNNDRFGDTRAITSRGGQFSLVGNSGAATTETVGALNMETGYHVVTVSPNALQSTQITFANITRGNRSTLFVRGTGLGTILGPNVGQIVSVGGVGPLVGGGGGANTTNISIVPYAYGNAAVATADSVHVTYGATGFRPLNVLTEYFANLAGAGATDNVNLTITQAVAPGGQTVNALRAAPGAAINITGGAGDVLTVTSGSIVVSPAAGATLTTIAAPLAFGAAEGIFHANGGTLAAAGTFGGLEVSGVISGSNGITKGALGILALSGLNTYTGTTTMTGGILLLRGDASNNGTASIFGQSTSTIEFHSAAAGSIIAASGGTRTINRNFNVTTGAQALPTFATTLATDLLVLNGNINITSANGSFSNSFLSFANLNPTATTAANHVVNGQITGNGGINMGSTAAGTVTNLTLNGNNSYSGGTQIGLGTLTIGHNNALGTGIVYTNAAGTIVAGGGARTIPNDFQLQADVIFAGTNALTINGFVDLTGGPRLLTVTSTAPVTFAGEVRKGSMILAGGGTLALNSTSNTYVGSTIIRNGTLVLGGNALVGSGTLGTNPQTGIASSGTVQLGDATTGLANNTALLVSGAHTVARNVTVNNQNTSGTATVGGANTSGIANYSGQLTLNRTANATRLTAAAGGSVNFSGLITESALGSGVSIVGGGTVIFSNATGNTYTGTTTVNSGVLLINNSSGSALGTGAVTVESGGRLGVRSTAEGGTGIGSFSGGLTINSGGFVKAGNSVGLLTVGGGLTLNAGSTAEFEINGTTTPGTDFSQIISSGLVTINSATLVLNPSVIVPLGTTITLVRNDSGAAVTGIFAGLAEGSIISAGPNLFQLTYVFNDSLGDGQANDIAITSVPEPATMALIFSGTLGMGGYWWRRRQKNFERLVVRRRS